MNLDRERERERGSVIATKIVRPFNLQRRIQKKNMFNRRREGACEAGSTSSFSGSSLRHRQVPNVVVSTLGPLLVGGFVRLPMGLINLF